MRLWLVGGGVALLITAILLAVWFKHPAPVVHRPPQPDLTGADDEVVEAIQQARKKVERHPTAATWGRLGEVLLAHEFNVEANECFEEAARLDPDTPAWPYLEGSNLIVHDPDKGIPYLRRAVERAGTANLVPKLLLAEVLLTQDQQEEAGALLEEVQRVDPTNVRARLALGRLALLRQNWRTGLDMLRACENDVHCRKEAHTLLAEAWNQLHEPQKANAAQKEAAKLPADQPWPDPYQEEVASLRRGLQARFALVGQLMQSQKYGEAVRLLQDTVQRYPDAVEGWVRLGELMAGFQRLDQAEECFQQAVNRAPGMAEAWSRLGTIQLMRHSPKARASLETAIRLKPDHAQAHYNLGQFYLRERSDRARAAIEFRAALRCKPDYEMAAKALHELGSKKSNHETHESHEIKTKTKAR